MTVRTWPVRGPFGARSGPVRGLSGALPSAKAAQAAKAETHPHGRADKHERDAAKNALAPRLGWRRLSVEHAGQDAAVDIAPAENQPDAATAHGVALLEQRGE